MSTEFDADQSFIPANLNLEVYVQQMAALLNLPIPASQLPSVVENFRQVQNIARPVLEFALPDGLEAAPRFEP